MVCGSSSNNLNQILRIRGTLLGQNDKGVPRNHLQKLSMRIYKQMILLQKHKKKKKELGRE